MMAIQLGTKVVGYEKRNHQPTQSITDKRVTPFSIDDILSSSKVNKVAKTLCSTTTTNLNGLYTKWLPFQSDCLPSISCWNEEAQTLWLEYLYSLCSVRAFHPYWTSHLQPDSAFSNTCCRLFNPRTSQSFKLLEKCKELQGMTEDSRSNAEDRGLVSLTTSEDWFQKRSESGSKRKREESSGSQGAASSGNWSTDSEDSYPRHQNDSSHSDSNSPLTALEKLTCTTFKGMEKIPHQLHTVASEQESRKAKRRKCRTAFTSIQLSLLEQRFNCHKYLTPTDRDRIAQVLGLSASQVITWFQNRRAKQKRELEEMRNDIKTVETSVKCNVNWSSIESISARAKQLDFQSHSNR